VKNGTVALSFLFDKHYLIIEYLDLKDLSRGLQMNCANSFCFHVYLMLHACAGRFDVTGNLENFWQLNKATAAPAADHEEGEQDHNTIFFLKF